MASSTWRSARRLARPAREAALLHEVAIIWARSFARFAVAGPVLGVELINARRHVADTARFPALVRVPRVRAQLIVITRTVAGAVLRIHRIDAVTLDGLDCRLVGRCAGGRRDRDLGRGGGGSRTRGRTRTWSQLIGRAVRGTRCIRACSRRVCGRFRRRS